MSKVRMDTTWSTAPTGLRLRRACAAVRAKNVAMGFKDEAASGDVLLETDPWVQELWARVADAACEDGTREERAARAGAMRDHLEGRDDAESGMMRHFTSLWLQVVDAVAACA